MRVARGFDQPRLGQMRTERRHVVNTRGLLAVALMACVALSARAQTPKPKVLKLIDEMKINIGQRTIHSIAFSPDGKLLAIGEDNVHIYNVAGDSPKAVCELKSRVAFGVHGLAFSPDGKLLAMGGGDHSIRLWEVNAQKELFQSRSHQACVRSVAFDPAGKVLATGSDDRTVLLWDVADDGKVIERTALRAADTFGDAVRAVVFTGKGSTLFEGCSNGSFRTFTTGNAPKQINLFKAKSGYGDMSVAGSPDGKIWAITDHKKVLLFSTKGTELGELIGHLENVRGVAFSPDGKIVASAGEDGKLAIWSVSTKTLRISKDRPGKFSCVAFAPISTDSEKSDYTVAGGLEDGSVVILKLGYRTK
jgi:WD40 repeat protein